MVQFLFLLMFSTFSIAQTFDWQGHRGARGLYPENTIGAMEEALKYPITTLELDVVISKDHRVVVSHEPWLNPEICHANHENIYKLNYEDIVKVDCGSKPFARFPDQRKVNVGKPLLSKLIKETEAKLKKINRTGIEYSVEIKSTVAEEKSAHQPDYKKFTELVVKELQDQLSDSRFLIQSFDWRVLKYLNEKYPEIRLVALREEPYEAKKIPEILGFKPYVFSPYYKLLTKEDISHFHSLGIKVIPWTVNSVEEMKKMIKIGVDGIITDYPNLISSVSESKCKSGTHMFEGKCVNIPKHAEPSDEIPGWNCKAGYLQKRSQCIKITVPENAHLLNDGKSWMCNEGFVRYRGICRKE